MTTDIQRTVACLLGDHDFIQKMNERVEPADFPDGPTRVLAAFALRYFQEHQQLVTPGVMPFLIERLEDDEGEAVQELYDWCVAAWRDTGARPALMERAEHWLKDRWVGRALDEATEALSHNDREGAIESLSPVMTKVYMEHTRQVSLVPTELGEVIARKSTDDFIPTGVDPLDEVLEGGLRPAELGIVLAYTNVGKSMILAMFAAQAYLSNKRVLYYTSELTPEQTIQRIAAAVFKRPINSLTDAQLYSAVLEQVKERALLDRASVVVRELPDNLRGIDAELSDLRRKGEYPDLMILDTADDLHAKEKHQTLYGSLSEIYSEMRQRLCTQERLAIWTSCQTNRKGDVDRGKLKLSHIGDAFTKVQRAHLVVGAAQTDEEFHAPFGPLLRLMILKDTLHGEKGKGWRFQSHFGPKEKVEGYPGLVPDEEGF